MRDPTVVQQNTLAALRDLTRELGEAPSAAQVARRLGVARPTAVKALHSLANKGMVRDVPKVVSSGKWAITADGEPWTPSAVAVTVDD